MKTLHNIWELEQLSNYTLKQICFDLDYILYSENEVNYNYCNKAELVGNIASELSNIGISCSAEQIDYLLKLVKEGDMELENH